LDEESGDDAMDMLLDLINSYEHRVIAVENLVNSAYETTLDDEDSLSQAYRTEEKLRDNLRETLVRNCSLRRADFDALTARIFTDIDMKKTVIERERKVLRERLRAYLQQQKELAISLKGQLAKLDEDSSQKSLEAVLHDIKKSQKEEGEQIFTLFRDFQFRLKTLCREIEELNDRLRRVLERGESLQLEDLRQFRASLAHEQRKAERKLRSEDVQRLLAHFNMERQESIYQWHRRGT
jgi:regulator of replication initiation timing